nr:hypothetical protein GCM10020185_53910 [Pseudomonas brassicacearum subsp. brassicacearum]
MEKNVLLRGKQPADLDKYWKQFEERQHDVQGILGELIGHKDLPAQIKARIERLRDEHRQLGSAYQKGRDAFVAAGADATAGDAAVKGVDRAASEQMSELVAELHKMGSEQSVSISTGADRTILLGTVVMLVSGLLIGVFSLWMVNRNLVQPIRNLIAYVTQLSHGRFFPSGSSAIARTNWAISPWRPIPCAISSPKPSRACNAVPRSWTVPAVNSMPSPA